MRLKFIASLLLATSLTAGTVQADITSIITDSFTTETTTYNPAANPWQTLNFTNFQNWNVTRGTVDLVNTGGTYPSSWFNHGVTFNPSFSFIDLDGTNGTSGQITSKNTFNLQPGQYRLQFDLAGAQGRDPRHHSDGVTVRLAGLGISNHYELAWDAPFSTQTLDFTVTTPTDTTLSFANESDDPSSLNDNQGPLLSNINLLNLTGGIAAVPEAGSILIATGLGVSLLLLRRFAKRNQAI